MAARPLVFGTCPECGGMGELPAQSFEEDGAMVTCLPCDGIGDLDAYRLMAAYRAGVAEGTRRVRAIAELAGASVTALETRPEPSIAWLKAHVSVPAAAGEEVAA